ncbi:hypothetical protein A2160_06260 [Candidatus Beckwithbacteria bacterium RBG_13_42_9]|uniref:histidine kinase n=1 Tax=Candidatus Beckwithbacteria bacterium RBG_13_42_9 TaxID=1797457 RepID=A0A1F5E5F3_9BACT|nr:MAG: hypothetical protein A2160_06260 [Candidatus Beckwithbacteria bacterium RBG_13_42_9]
MNLQRLKWYFFIILYLCLSFSTLSVAFAIEEFKTVKIGVYENKPKVYRDDKGVISGLFPDVLNYIAKQENWQLGYVFGTWDEGLQRLEKGEIDVMVDVAFSQERQEKFDFTNETVFSSWGVIYVDKNSAIDSFRDLDGQKIAILKSSVYFGGSEGIDQHLKAFGLKAEFINVNEQAEAFNLLDKGEVDAAVVSRVFALTNQKNYPHIKETDMFFNPTELRFALTKGDSDNQYLIDRLDHWVKKLKEESGGIYDESLSRHDLTGIITTEEVIPYWVRLVGLVSAAILLLSGLVIIGLRRARTIIIKKLEEKENLLGNIVNHAPIIVFAFNNQGIITLAEGKALKEGVLKQGFLVGNSVFGQFKDNQMLADQIKKTLSGEEVELQSELAGKMWRMNFSPILIAGQVKSVVGVAVDLTQEVQLDHAKMEFLSLASHHLRTLPTGIRWTLELLSPNVEKVLGKEDLKHWRSLEETNMRMIDLANTISRASQLELGKFYAFSEKFNLPKLIDEEIEQLQVQIAKKELKLTKNYSIEEVVLDKSQIKMIVHILLDNAVRYISPQGSVEVSLLPKADKFIFKVQDTGWGIPKNQQEKVFTKLFRADNVVKMDASGMGLSLFITKSIVEKLGGRIWFESEVGRGSTFYVELPQKRI